MGLISNIKDKDWVSVRQATAKLGSLKLGPTSVPTFAGLKLTGLTDNNLIYSVSGGVLTSLGSATNGQIPIGSTGAAPVLAGITGTTNQITVTNGAGSITLSTPQDIHTGASPTFVGLTLSGLTATRLVQTDGSKGLLSVDDLTNWIAGTTDRVTVTDDSDGSVTLDLAANTQTLLDSFNGIFLETINFTVSESGGTVTGSLEQDGGGDLTQRFSDGYSTLDCTPAATIDLTAYVGTDAVPKEVFVYILQSAKTTIAASNSDWPATEHIKIANLLLRSAATTGTDGSLVNRNWNDHTQSSDSQGHITHIEERVRQENAQWKSGVSLTLKDSGGNALTTGNSDTAVELVTTAGNVYQLHKQTFPATDMYITATDDAHIANQVTDEGGAYATTTDLVTDITVHVDGTASGTAIGVNKYFNLVIWGVQNRTGETSHIMINIPTGQYTSESNATADVDGYSVYDIPSAFKGIGFLIARLTFRLIAGAQWTYIAQEDLRGQVPSASAGVGISTTDHALLANLDFASAGHTGFQAQGDVLDDLNTLGANAADSEFLVGTGAGALAWESGATARTSLGLTIGTDVLAWQAIGIADNNLVEIDHATVADNDYAKFTAAGLEGRSYSEVLSDLSGQASASFDLNGQDLTNGGVIFLTEQAAGESNVAGKGQIWVKTATPNELYFQDDAGTDWRLGDTGLDLKIGCSVYLGTSQTITTSTYEVIEFDTATFDKGSDFDITTNHRFTAPETGEYFLCASANMVSMDDGDSVLMRIRKNGTTNIAFTRLGCPANATAIVISITKAVQLTANDYITADIWHDHGSDRTLDDGDSTTYFSIHRLTR